MQTDARLALPFAGILILAALGASLDALADPPPPPLGTVVVRVEISNVWLDTDAAGPNDWMINALLFAPDHAQCRAQAGTGHNRSYTPRVIDFMLRLNGQEAMQPCVDATYQINLTAYQHDFDNLIDLQGEPAGRCSTDESPPRAHALTCTGMITGFKLTGIDSDKSGILDGTADGNANETNMRLNYRAWVPESNVDGITAPNHPSWVVRLHIDELNIPNDLDPDWLIDGIVQKNDGTCWGEGRTPHSRFFINKVLDIVVRNASSCDGAEVDLRFVAYKHYSDAYLDLNNVTEPGIPQPCGLQPGNPADLVWCEVRHTFALTNNNALGPYYATGIGDPFTALEETDAELDYRITIWKQPPTQSTRITFSLVAVNALLDDWLIDGEATTASGCIGQARTAHSRFVEPFMLDLVFRGDATCMDSDVTVTLFAYQHATDGMIDLNPNPLDGPCSSNPTPQPVEFAGCRFRVVWDPDQVLSGIADGRDDGLSDSVDGRLTWELRKY